MTPLGRLRTAPLLIAILLAVPPLFAAPHEMRRSPVLSRRGLEGLVLEAWARMSRVWEKEGSSSDPFGIPKTSAPPPRGSVPSKAARSVLRG